MAQKSVPAGPHGDALLVEVAVPLPLPTPLTYRVPPAWQSLVSAGSRVSVPVGRRRLTGVVLGETADAPEGVQVRDLLRVVDLEPVLPADLLDLARFVADYYLEPIGEVVRAMLPGELGAWGARRVKLTSAGALARPRSAGEERIVQVLLEHGRLSIAELLVAARELPGPVAAAGAPGSTGRTDDGLRELVDRMAEEGRLAVEEQSGGPRGGPRYTTAVELPPGDRAIQLDACGRSPQGRAVVEYLAALGRPATAQEVEEAVGCSAAVVRRLVARGVLRRFTQIERLSLASHVLDDAHEPNSRGARGGRTPAITLRPDQAGCLEALCAGLRAGRFAPFLLHGMTGSGKTEVYLRAVAAALEAGRSAILLVPEIALVPALASTARQRFGRRLALLHSGLGRSEREQEWERIRSGAARVVLGPRSALFAPVVELGLVVVDEEQDSSYKQDKSPRYNGRDLALVRARTAGAVAVLASATPSLESRYNVEQQRYRPLQLTERVGQGRLPEGVLVDLRREPTKRVPGEIHFSSRLCEEVEQSLARDEQIILLRNRRGYSPLYLCRACGEDLRCDDCGLPRTFHRREGRLICHYCGSLRLRPDRCPKCGEAAMEPVGAGTERVEEDFQERFPGVPVGVLDRDSVRRKGGLAAVLESFRSGKSRVLIGTQMVSKGHHFPNVALTAVLAADTYLGFPDFRAVERTYTLLTQLAGRAGRGDRPGKVVIQTYHPEHYAIRAALENDDEAFAAEEMRFRRIFHYPPFSRMVQLLLRDAKRERGAERIAELARALEAHPLAEGIRLLGPAPAPLEKLRGKWRYQLLLRGPSGSRLRRLVAAVVVPEAGAQLTIDVDPYDLM